MKKTFIALVATAAVSAASADMLAGWDFSQYAFDGFTSTDGTTLAGTLDANYTGGAADFGGAASLGTLYYDGATYGTSANSVFTPLGGLATATGNQGYLGTAGSLATLGFQGQAFTNEKALATATDGAIFAFEVTAGTVDFESFEYAAYNQTDASSTLTWEVSVNGGGFSGLDVDAITNSATAFSIDLTGITADTLVVRATLSGLDANNFALDNVVVNGTVVPEPSTYAAIFGAIALAFAAVRRRK